MSYFYGLGFSTNDAREMALVVIFDDQKAGIKLLKKDNGTADFKELSVEYIKDATGKLLSIKIKKCQ